MKAFEFVNTSFLKIIHEHVLPKDDDLWQSLLKRAIVKDYAADRMRTFYFLYLLALSIWIFYLFSQLRNVHPIEVNNVLNEFLLTLIFPKQRRVSPFILWTVFSNLVADFIQIIQNFRWIFLDINIITNLIIGNQFLNFYLFFLDRL